MKVLWIVGSLRNCIREIAGYPLNSNTSGGWVDACYAQVKDKDTIVDFLCCDRNVPENEFKKNSKGLQTAYILNQPKISFGKKGSKKTINLIKQILDDSKPDIIHIWGSEMALAYNVAMANVDNIPIVLFVQGMVYYQSKYLSGERRKLSKEKINFNSKKKEFISFIKQIYYKKQIELENALIKHTTAILTDNEYSISYYKNLNQKLKCINYSLPMNEVFLNNKWCYKSCCKNTVFTIFGDDMNKGLFQLLIALKKVKELFNDIKVIFPGPYHNLLDVNIDIKSLSVFEYWARSFILKYDLKNNVEFIGYQTPDQMANNIMNANLFVNPSCNEVQATSLRESMFLGCPSITSDRGAINEFCENGVNSYIYDYEDSNKLADLIIEILNRKESINEMSERSYNSMREKFLNQDNKSIEDIYREVLKDVK